MSKIRMETIDGSIIMAVGIIINGIGQKIPFVRYRIGPSLTVILIIFLFILYFTYLVEMFQGTFYTRRIRHPIQSFSIGTLVAAASVVIISIAYEIPLLNWLAFALFWFNLFLWFLYFGLVLRNYCLLFIEKDLVEQVHGVILLACVTIQALILSGKTLFGYSFPNTAALCFVLLGTCNYVFGLAVILKRYVRNRNNYADEWLSTNCIIHGAASITGLTGILSHALPDTIAAVLWLWVLFSFLFIETIEMIRAFLRIRKYGWKQGIFTYSVSQWARNFTFGMFLAFTINLPTTTFGTKSFYFHELRFSMTMVGTVLVFFLFFVELFLYAANFVNLSIVKEKKSEAM